jgi:hypothetical protein
MIFRKYLCNNLANMLFVTQKKSQHWFYKILNQNYVPKWGKSQNIIIYLVRVTCSWNPFDVVGTFFLCQDLIANQ